MRWASPSSILCWLICVWVKMLKVQAILKPTPALNFQWDLLFLLWTSTVLGLVCRYLGFSLISTGHVCNLSQGYACPNHDHSLACWDPHFYWQCCWTWASPITPNPKSSLTPQLCSSHVISSPGRTSLSTQLGGGWERRVQLQARIPQSSYPKFSLWDINTSQVVSGKFSECWDCCFCHFCPAL